MFLSVLFLIVFLFVAIPLLMSPDVVKALQEMWAAKFKLSKERNEYWHKEQFHIKNVKEEKDK